MHSLSIVWLHFKSIADKNLYYIDKMVNSSFYTPLGLFYFFAPSSYFWKTPLSRSVAESESESESE